VRKKVGFTKTIPLMGLSATSLLRRSMSDNVQWMLFGMPTAQVVEDNIFSFALAVIRNFSPLNLTLPRWRRSSSRRHNFKTNFIAHVAATQKKLLGTKGW
jgi:hypothetical protein